MTGMQIAPNLTLPIDAATGTFAILATKGAGKSNAAVVTAEEMYDAGVPWVAIDPKGDWWGLRSSSDGKGPGLPIIVFGGRHGDLPLEPTAGSLIADLVLEQRITCVLDVSQFTKADTIRFLLAFGQHLFAHADDSEVEPIHLFLEEAHEYLPQSVSSRIDGGDIGKLVNVWQRIVKQGRFKGLGVTMISQRSSVLNKDVLELIDTLIVLRTIGPRSRKSIAEWVHDQDVDDGLLASLPNLKDGEAWVWSPGELKIIERIRFRRRRTFDSGATPKVGQVRRTPTTIADVDLAALKEAMSETIERAKADDPKELRKQIAALRREQQPLRDQVAALEATVGTLEERYTEAKELADLPTIDPEEVAALRLDLAGAVDRLVAFGERLALPDPRPERPAPARAPAPPAARPTPTKAAPTKAAPAPPPARAVTTEGDGNLPGPQRKLLTVLATYGPRTKVQLALLAGYSANGGGFNNPLGALRSSGYVERGDPITITDAGLDALGAYDPLPTGPELLDHWLASLPGPAAKILAELARRWPDSCSKDELAEATGYSPVGGGFNNPLGKLRTLQLVNKGADVRLTDDFGDAIT